MIHEAAMLITTFQVCPMKLKTLGMASLRVAEKSSLFRYFSISVEWLFIHAVIVSGMLSICAA